MLPVDIVDNAPIPLLFKKNVNSIISKIVYALLKPNFSELVRGIEQYVKENKSTKQI